MHLERRNYYRGFLAILVAALLWSTLGIMGKLLIKEGVDIIAGVSLRPFFAFLILFAFRPIFPKNRRAVPENGTRKALFFALFGLVGVTSFYILYFLAVKTTSISLAVILLYTAPIWVLVFSLLSRWEKFSPEKGAGIFLSLLGIFLIAQASWGESSPLGLFVGLGSAITYALFTYFGKIALEKYDLGTVLTWVFGFGTLGFVPFWLLKPELVIQLFFHPMAIFISFLLGLGPTAISYGAYLWALNYVPPTVAALTCTLEPVLGSVWGILFFGEKFTLGKAIGGSLILMAVIIASLGKGKFNLRASLLAPNRRKY